MLTVAVRLLTAAAFLLVCGCGGSPVEPSATVPVASTSFPGLEGGVATLRTVSALNNDQPVARAAIQVDGLGDATSDANGYFQLHAEHGRRYPIRVTAPGFVPRETSVLIPAPPGMLSLIPNHFDLGSFDQMCRTGQALVRWTTAPVLVIQTAILDYASATGWDYVALPESLSESEVARFTADLVRALPRLTVGQIPTFAAVQTETAMSGTRVSMFRPGAIVVTGVRGLWQAGQAAGGQVTAVRSNMVQGGRILFDIDWLRGQLPSQSGHAPDAGAVYLIRQHELGHAMGYNHTARRDSFMNAGAVTDLSAFDVQALTIDFQRPPGNRGPDVDPDVNAAPATFRLDPRAQK